MGCLIKVLSSEMMKARWQFCSEFPDAPAGWSALFPLVNLQIDGRSAVERYQRYANILAPVLLSSPATGGKYLPPLLLDSGTLAAKLYCNAKIMLVGSSLFAVLGSVLLYFVTDLRLSLSWFGMMSVCFGYAYFSYRNASEPGFLTGRSSFYGWSMVSGVNPARFYLLFMCLIGGLQYLASEHLSFDEVLNRYGLLFKAVPEGEYWRILTGPYLHTGLAHWLANILVGAGLVLVYWPCLGYRTVAVFVLCASASFLGTYAYTLVAQTELIGIVGVSGGIAGITGTFLAATYRYADLFPDKMTTTTIYVALISFLAFSYVTSPVSFSAHLTGFLLGIAIGFIFNPIDRSFLRVAE